MNENELLDRFKQGQRNFSKLMLRRAKLAKAELSLVTFDEANLEHSNFHSAQLAGANFIHARLGDVNFSFANLLGANFFKAQLRKANFTNALVSGGEFLAADLRQANFTNASCVGIDFSGANLQDTDFSNANLQQANLTGANLLGADLTGADLEGTSLEGAVMPDGSVLNFASDDQDVTQLENAAAPVAQQSVASESKAPVEEDSASSDSNALIPILRFGDLDLDVQGNFFNPLDPEQAANPSGADTNADTNAAPSVASEANTSAELQPPLTQPLESDDVNTRLEMAPTSSTSEPATQSESPTETYSLGRFQLGTSRPIPYHFQQQVLKAYGQQCAMTGNPIQAVLEVIMIQPDTEFDQDHPSNGLVLRADLAKLFRLRLIAVIP
ncbi:MAG: pentapeptide repeat-containing protein, partial [Cyanobacteria bacterium P01_H01_bin.121]